VLSSFACTAPTRLRPSAFVEDIGIEIAGGRHPVVEAQIEGFIANDCRLSPMRRLLLITGPNMAANRPTCGRWR